MTYRDHESCEDRPCIGTLAECEAWEADLNEGPCYLGNGEASGHTRIAEIVYTDADYQGWIDSIDSWDGCPSEDDSDYDANTAWAEDQAYQRDGVLPIAGPLSNGRNTDGYGNLILVDLSPAPEVSHV